MASKARAELSALLVHLVYESKHRVNTGGLRNMRACSHPNPTRCHCECLLLLRCTGGCLALDACPCVATRNGRAQPCRCADLGLSLSL